MFNNKEMQKKIIKAIRLIALSLSIGVILGLAGGAFYLCIKKATDIRRAHPAFLLLLPIGAVLINFFYNWFEKEADGGTNRVIEAVYSTKPVSIKMTASIFVTTVFSHLCGASVGREGAALQLGGSVGYNLARALRLSDDEKNMCVVMGMGACFSALFGTPMAAAVFALEIAVVGRTNPRWLFSVLLSSYTARFTAAWIGAPNLSMELAAEIPFSGIRIVYVSVIAAVCGLISLAFVTLIRKGMKRSAEIISDPYLRGFFCGVALLMLSLLFRGQEYNGAGVEMIPVFMKGGAMPYQFILKIVFTLISVWAGYRGGEIVPALYIGAALGSVFSNLFGVYPELACGVGMVSLFCGVTNCPMAAFVIGIEIFGAGSAPYFLAASAVAFICSGRRGLYSAQRWD